LGVPILINHPGVHNINDRISYAYSLFAHIIPDDNKLLILIILVFLFCPCLFTSNSLYDAGYINEHSRQLIRCTYNQYTQSLWYYIMEKSLDNEQQAILTYMKIVTKFLHLQNVMSEIYGIVECSVQIDRLHMIMQSILHLT
jgi:ABC-type multidrug transport system permease subunit